MVFSSLSTLTKKQQQQTSYLETFSHKNTCDRWSVCDVRKALRVTGWHAAGAGRRRGRAEIARPLGPTFRTCIGLRAGSACETFRAAYSLRLQPRCSGLNTITDSTARCVVGRFMKDKKNLFKFRKSYIHIDNNVKFKMYKSSKSLQSEKVVVFGLPTLARKKIDINISKT